MKYAPIFLVLFLAACATPEQIAAAKEQQRQADMSTCASYNFRPNSDAFRNCMLQLNIARDQRDYYNTYHYESYPRFYGGMYRYH